MNVYVVAKSNRVVVEEKIYLYCCYLYRKSGLQRMRPIRLKFGANLDGGKLTIFSHN